MSNAQSLCVACGEPVSVNDAGGCVGTDPGAYHFKPACLLEAARRENARAEGLQKALERISNLSMPYRDFHSAARSIASAALKEAGA